MKARDVMTTPVVCVPPDASTRDVARLLLEQGVSGVPVIDPAGVLLGFVSEGDLIAPPDAEREAQRERWLARLAEGEQLASDFLAHVAGAAPRTAGAVMTAPAISVTEETPVAEIAQLLADRHVKRVPVTRAGVVVGLISRIDILRAVSDPQFNRATPRPAEEGFGQTLRHVVAGIESRFTHEPPPPPAPVVETTETAPSAADFQRLTAAYTLEQERQRLAARRAAEERRHHEVEALEQHHLKEQEWGDLMRRAREAAAAGAKEFLLLRFPCELCADGGRAINAPEEGWPTTLRGEAAELFSRWERDLKPHGFGLHAQILNFPGGRPGDVGLTLNWGG